jgi:hypothetical protein
MATTSLQLNIVDLSCNLPSLSLPIDIPYLSPVLLCQFHKLLIINNFYSFKRVVQQVEYHYKYEIKSKSVGCLFHTPENTRSGEESFSRFSQTFPSEIGFSP